MSEALLDVDGLDAFYGDFQALFGVSMRVEAGAIAAVIGANGAGKSTLLKSIAGLMDARPAAIRFGGVAIAAGRPTAPRGAVSRWCLRAGGCFLPFQLRKIS
jgi:branched-chain amino acid transport system ATP-binding protein